MRAEARTKFCTAKKLSLVDAVLLLASLYEPITPSMAAPTSAREPANISTFSISQLLALHPRERLFVHPLLWTTRHLQLFHCQFRNLGEITVSPVLSPPQAHSVTIRDDADEVQRYLDKIRGDHTLPRRLAISPHPMTRASALFRLLRERTYCGYVCHA
jgi:hypothetical protein